MYFSDDHGGIAAYLIGLVAIVFIAIGFSLLADMSSSDGKSERELRNEIKRDHTTLRSLQARLQRQRLRFEADPPPASDDSQSLTRLQAEALTLEELVSDLRRRKDALSLDLTRVDESLTSHRRKYRLQVRGAAIGERLETLTLGSGKVLHDVVIRGSDESGLRVHHHHGSARVPFIDLPREWRERLHWSEDELISAVAEVPPEPPTEAAPPMPRQVKPAAADAPRKPAEKPTAPVVAQAELTAARERFLLARSTLQRAGQEARRARQKSHGPDRSVPGSLETWADRAERFTRIEERARGDYAKARHELRSLSPGDPLLVQSTTE